MSNVNISSYFPDSGAELDSVFTHRMNKHHDELKWLYMELYDNEAMFRELCNEMYRFYLQRSKALKDRDLERIINPNWYKSNELLGLQLYIQNFNGTIKGVEEKLDYIKAGHFNYIHLMPFLDTVDGRSDGGYAVADFRKVKEELGTIEDLMQLTESCHEEGINVCMDFVMNHTSSDHEWARKAAAGDPEYQGRYFFYETDEIPNRFEQTMPQVFPTTAPGNFTWLPEAGHYVMTTFYPYQWDLNYGNPKVFNEMMYNFLFFANVGMDIIRIDAVPYIWKELGTLCRNLRQVHTIVRMMRMIGEVVAPSTILLGEVVMEPVKVVPYFGTVEKPECHMLYNVTTMATTWHSVATRDVRLLKQQLDQITSLPQEYVFLNYLRCHDDIGWGLDYGTLRSYGMEEVPHKKYLNDYFCGKAGASVSRGELYNDDPVTMDARFCGTTASMCGIEAALESGDQAALDIAIRFDLTLHAYMFMQSGIPIIYSGDEIGMLNDWDYKKDPLKAEDSRYIHRGKMPWDKVEEIDTYGSVEEQLFHGLEELEVIRRKHKAFLSDASMWTLNTYDQSLLAIGRYFDGEKIIGVFNFSGEERTAWIHQIGPYMNLMTGEMVTLDSVVVPAYGFAWLMQDLS